MSISVPADIFKWLQSVNLVKEGKKVQDNKIEIAPDTSESLKVGYLFAQVIKAACRSQPNYADIVLNLNNLKENPTPAIRLYNWNMLAEALKKISLPLEPEVKKAILDGEAAPVTDLIKAIYDKFILKEATKIGRPMEIDMGSVSPKKPLNQSSNVLEFTVISLSKNLKISPHQALNLFLENNKYLAHLLVKGVKGSYSPILEFLQDVFSNAEFIVLSLFCNQEKESVQFLFNVLKPGLISKEEAVAELTLEIFKKIHETYSNKQLDQNVPREWLLGDGINSFLYSIKRHQSLTEAILSTLLDYLQDRLFSTISPNRNTLWTDNKELLQLYGSFLQILAPPYTAQFANSKEIAQWTKLIIKQLQSPQKQMKLKCAIILEKMWSYFPTYFQQSDRQLPSTLINTLKSLALENDTVSSHQALVMLFNLMLGLGLERNSYAPSLFKTLVSIFSFVTVDDKMQLIADNFIVNFKELPNLPAGPLMTPLLTIIQNKVSASALELCKTMVELNRLTVLETMQVSDILVKTLLSDNTHSQFCLLILEQALDSLDFDEEVQQFVIKSSKLGLSMVYAHMKSTRPIAHLQKEYDKYKEKLPKSLIEEAKLYFSLKNIASLLGIFIKKYPQIHGKLNMFVMHTYLQIKKDVGKDSKLLFNLLKQIQGDESKVEESLKTIEVESSGNINDKNMEIDEGDRGRVKSMTSSRLDRSEINLSSLHPNIGLKSPISESVQLPLDTSTLKPTKRALKEIQSAKIRRDELRLKSQEQMEKSRFETEKTNKLVRGLLQKRSIQLGISSKKDVEVNCLFEWDTVKQATFDEIGLPSIHLMHLPSEEDSYVDSIESFIRHYRKVWRFLFFKYSSSGVRNKQALASFKTQQKINLAQIVKMVRDYQVQHIKKEQIQSLMRLINQKQGRVNDLLNLTYLGFEEFIMQLCVYLYNKPEQGLYHSPPVRHLRQFLSQLKAVTQQRNGSIDLFQNPQNAYFQQGDVIKEFNRRLAENPRYILPEGYKKVREVEVHFNYNLSEAYDGFSDAYRTCSEVLSQIVFARFGFNFIEPKSHKTETYRAKPVLFNNLMEKLKDHKQGYLKPKRAASTAERSPPKFKQVDKNQFHPLVKFSLGIKLGLSSVSIKDKYIADEVAYWMDDMLDSVERGSNVVHNKAHKVIENQYMRKRKDQIQSSIRALKQFDDKTHRRDRRLKARLEPFKEEVKKKRQADLDLAKKQREREQAQKRKREQQYRRIKEMLSKKKQQEASLKKAKESEEQARKQKIKEEYKKQVDHYFQKKREEVKGMEEQMKKKKQEEAEKKQQEEKETVQKQNKLYIHILKKDESILNRVVDVKIVYSDVWQSPAIQKVNIQYENELRILFDLLLKYQKSKISATNYNEISSNTFNLFTVKFKITPFMVSKNAVSQIYRSFLKQEPVNEDRKGVFGLDFPKFKQALFKICIKAKQILNGFVQKAMQQKQIQKTLAKKALDGNHYEVGDIVESPTKQSSSKKKQRNPQLISEYTFDPTDVKPATLQQLYKFLQLPHDKQGIQVRFRQALQSKARPTALLVKELQSQN